MELGRSRTLWQARGEVPLRVERHAATRRVGTKRLHCAITSGAVELVGMWQVPAATVPEAEFEEPFDPP